MLLFFSRLSPLPAHLSHRITPTTATTTTEPTPTANVAPPPSSATSLSNKQPNTDPAQWHYANFIPTPQVDQIPAPARPSDFTSPIKATPGAPAPRHHHALRPHLAHGSTKAGPPHMQSPVAALLCRNHEPLLQPLFSFNHPTNSLSNHRRHSPPHTWPPPPGSHYTTPPPPVQLPYVPPTPPASIPPTAHAWPAHYPVPKPAPPALHIPQQTPQINPGPQLIYNPTPQQHRGLYDASGRLLPLHAQNYEPSNDPWNNYGADEQPQ